MKGETMVATVEVEVEAPSISTAARKLESEVQRFDSRPQNDMEAQVKQIERSEEEDDGE